MDGVDVESPCVLFIERPSFEARAEYWNAGVEYFDFINFQD
jgi:hypothetical protein